jgi:hypothetical protein
MKACGDDEKDDENDCCNDRWVISTMVSYELMGEWIYYL